MKKLTILIIATSVLFADCTQFKVDADRFKEEAFKKGTAPDKQTALFGASAMSIGFYTSCRNEEMHTELITLIVAQSSGNETPELDDMNFEKF